MQNIRIIVPICLFFAFAIAHRMANTTGKTYRLLAATKTIEEGGQITGRDLTEVVVTAANHIDLKKSFAVFPTLDEEVVYGKVNRQIEAGELITLRDLQQPEEVAPKLKPDEYGVHIPIDRLNFASGQLYVGIHIGFLLEKRTKPGISVPTETEDGVENSLEPVPLGPFRVVAIGDRVNELNDQSVRTASRVLTIAAKVNDDGTLEKKVTRLLKAAQESPQSNERILALVIWSKSP